jgi:DNA-binding winged helix-turn-helix (wHTH) protein
VAAVAENASTLYAGELEIRLGEGLVLATGRALTLSVREFELLAAMARRAGAIVTRGELYAEVWGGELRDGDRSVDVYVSKLRGKLEAAMPDRRFIHTHPGFGYRFQPQPSHEGGAPGTPNPDGPEAAGAAAGAAGAAGGEPNGLSRNVHIGATEDS